MVTLKFFVFCCLKLFIATIGEHTALHLFRLIHSIFPASFPDPEGQGQVHLEGELGFLKNPCSEDAA